MANREKRNAERKKKKQKHTTKTQNGNTQEIILITMKTEDILKTQNPNQVKWCLHKHPGGGQPYCVPSIRVFSRGLAPCGIIPGA